MKMAREELVLKIKECIINRLNLEVKPEEIDDDAPIFSMGEDEFGVAAEEEIITNEAGGRSLGLDSFDALELVVALNNEFNVEIKDEDMGIFQSINTIADFIEEKLNMN